MMPGGSLIAARTAPGHRGDAVAMGVPASAASADEDGFGPRAQDRCNEKANGPNSARAEKEEVAEFSRE